MVWSRVLLNSLYMNNLKKSEIMNMTDVSPKPGTENRKMIVKSIETPKGVKNIEFLPELREDENGMVCSACFYNKLCGKLPHPSFPDDKDKCFTDFCNNATNDLHTKGPTQGDYIPKPGTIEENLSDVFDVSKVLVEHGVYVKLGKVIDTVCSGVCPDYEPGHKKCSSANSYCILSQLFKGGEDGE